jgi:hypothetical protein
MSAMAIPNDEWGVQFHESMAALARSRAAIRREVGILGIARGLWSVSRDLKNLRPSRDRIYASLSALPDGAIDDAQLREYVQSTQSLVDSIEELLRVAKRARLTNRTLTAGSLEAIRRHCEDFAQHVDVLQLSVDPEAIELIRQGREDFANEKTVPLDSLLHG